MSSETIEIIRLYSLDITLLLIPISFVIIATLKGFKTKSIFIYGLIISLVIGSIIQARYPGHAHVPGSEVFYIILVLLVCSVVAAISLLLRKIYYQARKA